MQTTRWGPHGWRLLNNIAANYPNNPTEAEHNLHKCFFYHLANVLPCIYCRLSYRQFIAEFHIEDWLKNKTELQYYVYTIHNKVNDKLRIQGYLNKENPKFSEIKHIFNRKRTFDDCGWDFLYAIAYNYPVIPKSVDKYNYCLFYSKLRFLLPYESVRHIYEKYFNIDPVNNWLNNRETLTRWFYNIYKNIIKDLKKLSVKEIMSYNEVSKRYESFRASCNSSNSNSCRFPDKNNK